MNVRDFCDFIEARQLFGRNDIILLAVSGGIDSVVMTHLFREDRRKFAVAHCNFGLRGAESDADERFVGQLAANFGVPFFCIRFNTIDHASSKGISIQMAARELRYAWFEQLRSEQGFACIATAHHLDDQAETFLINLIRGTGIAGLHGIPVRHGKIVRPLMFTWREEIETFAKENGIAFRNDHSNTDAKYLRNRIRHELIPFLKSFNPGFTGTLTETIGKLADFEAVGNRTLEIWAARFRKGPEDAMNIPLEDVRMCSPVAPYLWHLLAPAGITGTQLDNLVSSINTGDRALFLTQTHSITMEREILVIRPLEQSELPIPLSIQEIPASGKIDEPIRLAFRMIPGSPDLEIPAAPTSAWLDFDKISFPLTLRKWEKGDSFYPLGMRKRKKLSDFFIDQKLTSREKDAVWLLCSGIDIIWIIGYRIDHRFRITKKTRNILEIKLINSNPC